MIKSEFSFQALCVSAPFVCKSVKLQALSSPFNLKTRVKTRAFTLALAPELSYEKVLASSQEKRGKIYLGFGLRAVMTMGLVGSLAWVNAYSRKQCRSLFWRMRAALKKALKNSSGKKQFRFQYDPCSYALNFDDGCWKLGEGAATGIKHARTQQHSGFDINTTAWVYVLWVIPE